MERARLALPLGGAAIAAPPRTGRCTRELEGTSLRTVLKPARNTAFYSAEWQPGAGREAGRIAC